MTRINPDDPKWTAYVLGELDATERAAVESELESSEEARMLVDDLRFAADLTKAELREGFAVAALTPEERDRIRASANVLRPRRWFGTRPAVWATGLAAASVALIVLSASLFRSVQPAPKPVTIAEMRQTTEPVPAAKNDETKPAEEFALRYAHSAPVPAPAAPPATASKTVEPAFADSAVLPAALDVAPAAPGVPAPQAAASLVPPPPVPEATVPVLPVPGLPVPEPPISVPVNGRIFGMVQDATAARIPGAEVTATNIQTGNPLTTVSDGSGAYVFEGLQPGRYRLSASLPGFQTSVFDGLQLSANTSTQRDITLQVGTASETVQVTVANRRTVTAQSKTGAGGGQGVGGQGGALGGLVGRQGQQGQQSQQGQAAARNGVAAGQIRDQALNVYRSPVDAESSRASSRAPGVPPAFDRIAPRFNNSAESYDVINDNPFLDVGQNPLSTFSIDVDTASYSNVRRYLTQNQLPPRDAVRIEEMINYFSYDYPQPSGSNPISAAIEAAAAPWNPQHRLVRIGIKARDIAAGRRPASNLVFLLDVSGSMQPAERLPLLKSAMRLLVEQLTANDRVTVVTYAGTTGIALRPTRGDQKDNILRLIDSLQAGGSTNGASGIQLAYEQARANFIPGGVNRVILATDGDFNVGITDRNALLRLIEDKAKSGVFLSVLGVGMGNYKDATLETLADKGNGNFAYLDTLNEARKVLVDQMNGTLVTMAKDVKIQVEFNPAVVDAYRLIGYENRALRNEDFNNDLKDAGDMGAGHTVTALYEVVPRGVAINAPGTSSVDPLKYQQQPAPPPARNGSNETLTVKIRYKEPADSESKMLVFPLVDREQKFAQAGADFRFAAAVASFGMILRDSPYKGTATIDSVLGIAEDSLGSDRNGYRREFLQLAQRARGIRGR